ncbi:hypothetical protein OpiT1DRAFT_02743 [Opitutaceae bacterium TAV1]|nr:hypothetical protein OpiT1DRAFT_02743 [Opitutaceae bacterium TAV1]
MNLAHETHERTRKKRQKSDGLDFVSFRVFRGQSFGCGIAAPGYSARVRNRRGLSPSCFLKNRENVNTSPNPNWSAIWLTEHSE